VKHRTFYTLILIVLAAGYLAANLTLYLSHRDVDGQPGLTVSDVVTRFHGNPRLTRLTQMINGPMRKNLESEEQKRAIEEWVWSGADEAGYEEVVRPILQKQCVRCHDMFGKAEFAPLTTYEEVKSKAEPHRGITWLKLARLSHEHFFGMGLICFGAGFTLLRSDRWLRWKHRLVAGAFLSILGDIGGWWLTKLAAPFAWLVIVSGGLQVAFFAAIFCLAVYEMWFYRAPQPGASAG
jgi:hypothetical protein